MIASPPEKQKAFALVELIVVILILVFLGQILLPSLSLARKKAQQAACVENLRTLHTALMMYRSNYGVLPPSVLGHSPWSLLVEPFVDQKNKKISSNSLLQIDSRRCPALGQVKRSQGGHHYGMNVWITFWYQGKTASIPNPGPMMLLADSIYYGVGGYPQHPNYGGAAYALQGPYEHLGLGTVDRNRHTQGANSLFVDGHVELRIGTEISTSNSDVYWDGTSP